MVGRISEIPAAPVSHDPGIRKQVLVSSGVIPHLQQLAVVSLEPGQRTTSHVHHDMDEVFLVQSGSGIIEYQDEEQAINTGHCLHVPAGCSHAFRCDGPVAMVLLYFGVER